MHRFTFGSKVVVAQPSSGAEQDHDAGDEMVRLAIKSLCPDRLSVTTSWMRHIGADGFDLHMSRSSAQQRIADTRVYDVSAPITRHAPPRSRKVLTRIDVVPPRRDRTEQLIA
jgi:hypothetical protein